MYGELFEQMVGLELKRAAKLISPSPQILFWRDHAGPEVDYVIESGGRMRHYIPIEVKWTTNPSEKDARHLNTFLKAYPESKFAYLICRIERAALINEKVMALPWWMLQRVFE